MKDVLQRIGFVAGLGIAGLVSGCTTKTENVKFHIGPSCESGAQGYSVFEQNVSVYYLVGHLINREPLWPAKRTIHNCEPTLPQGAQDIVEREELIFEDGFRMMTKTMSDTY